MSLPRTTAERNTGRFWTPKQSACLGYLWADTEITVGQIAASLKRTERAVFRHAQKLGLPPRYTRWTPKRNNTLQRLWLDGLGAKKIARHVNSTPKMVCRQAKNLGLPRRVVRKGKITDISGRQFGRWRVIALHPKRTRGGQARWLCRCDCGRERIVLGSCLRSGRSQSCGCIRKEMFALVAGPPWSVQNENRRRWSNRLLSYVAATRRVKRGSWRKAASS